MKRLMFLLILSVFILSGVISAQAHDGNRNSVRRAWNAVQAQQKKDDAAQKVLLDQAQASIGSSRARRER